MTIENTSTHPLVIRPFQYRDLDDVSQFGTEGLTSGRSLDSLETTHYLNQVRQWYGPLKVLSLFPSPLQHLFSTFVAEQSNQICGLIQVSPFNCTQSTWRVNWVAAHNTPAIATSGILLSDVASTLLRYCFEKIWQARTWLAEVNVSNTAALALYRQNGFQPLAKVTYWSISPEQLQDLAQREPDLPNLLPVGNADAQLIYQLSTTAMPPLVRQVFDYQIPDFKTGLLQSAATNMTQWVNRTEVVSAYVFEPQRKAAIGHFQLTLCREGQHTHEAQLTVHPAYTWLYPELLAQMARVLQTFPPQSLKLSSLDYQPEREEYLTQIRAVEIEHTLMMSRSVWHKVRESKPVALEGLQLSDVLPGLQPVGKPLPGRMSWAVDAQQGHTIEHPNYNRTDRPNPDTTPSPTQRPPDRDTDIDPHPSA